MQYFIDKLDVYQVHENRLPIIGSNGFLRIDLENGEISDQPIVFNRKYEGSYSSSLQIACDGYKVSIIGNPSRWNRIDNLFGLQTIGECINVYNQILKDIGLPPFMKTTKFHYTQGRNGTNKRVGDGAVITHIDWTRNHAVGYHNEQTFLKALSTQSIDKSIPAFLYPNENTVEWFGKNFQGNGSSRRYVKCYAKAADLIMHQRQRCKATDHDNIDYYEKLLAFTINQGVVREEHSFKSKWLIDNQMNYYGYVTEEQFIPHLKSIDEIRARLEVTNMKYENIADELLNQGIVKTRSAANATQGYYLSWLHGHQFDRTKRQYREHKTRLKQIGIDIGIKLDISRSPLRLKESQVIEVKPLVMPDWYHKPVVTQSNVVQLRAA